MSAYKVEELLALRDSVSESAVSIDKFADEDVIKEHVLRPSASANLIGTGSEKASRSSTTPGVAAATAGKKPSPSPSVKRGKAERLLKEHGSPPGLRVTAGGRIVPSDLPPLGSARFTSNGFKAQTPNTVTPSNALPPQLQADVNNLSQSIQLIGGQPVICIGDRVFQIPSFTQDQNTLGTFVPAVTEDPRPFGDPGMASLPVGYPGVGTARSRFNSAALNPTIQPNNPLFDGLDLNTLKQRHAFKKSELKTLEQLEVLEAPRQSEAWRTDVVNKKVALVLEIDALRKQILIKEGKATSGSDSAAPQPATFPASVLAPVSAASAITQPRDLQQLGSIYAQPPMPMHVPQPLAAFQSYGLPGGPSPGLSQYAGTSVFIPNETARPFNDPVPSLAHANQGSLLSRDPNTYSPNSSARRSHAIEIKAPQIDAKKSSTLNPKSPTYEPPIKSFGTFGAPTPSRGKEVPAHSSGGNSTHSSRREKTGLQQRPSLSSIDTTDFFPTNTHEHSSTRFAPRKEEVKSKAYSRENSIPIPSTPQKTWGPDPWNPSSRGTGSNLPSRGSGSHLPSRGSNTNLSGPTVQASPMKKPPSVTEDLVNLALSRRVSKNSSDSPLPGLGHSAAEKTDGSGRWPPRYQPVDHILSTYQEGFQAGSNHVGLPKNLDVLRGYHAGLTEFLNNGLSRNPSFVKATAANTLPRSSSMGGQTLQNAQMDSGISVSFRNPGSAFVSHENMPSARSTHGNSLYAPMTFNSGSEMQFETHMSSAKREAFGNVMGGHEDSDSTIPTASYPRQFSGNQVSGRTMPTTSMKRFYPPAKEIGSELETVRTFARTPGNNDFSTKNRFSQLDGAVDDLTELLGKSRVEAPAKKETFTEVIDTEASCFGKAKQSSPVKTSSPAKQSEASSKSPSKNRLEQVTNKFLLGRGADQETNGLSPEERRNKWAKRFARIKGEEDKYVHDTTARQNVHRRKRSRKPQQKTGTGPIPFEG